MSASCDPLGIGKGQHLLKMLQLRFLIFIQRSGLYGLGRGFLRLRRFREGFQYGCLHGGEGLLQRAEQRGEGLRQRRRFDGGVPRLPDELLERELQSVGVLLHGDGPPRWRMRLSGCGPRG